MIQHYIMIQHMSVILNLPNLPQENRHFVAQIPRIHTCIMPYQQNTRMHRSIQGYRHPPCMLDRRLHHVCYKCLIHMNMACISTHADNNICRIEWLEKEGHLICLIPSTLHNASYDILYRYTDDRRALCLLFKFICYFLNHSPVWLNYLQSPHPPH